MLLMQKIVSSFALVLGFFMFFFNPFQVAESYLLFVLIGCI